MRLEWILLSPAGPYAALATGMVLCLFLFVTLKRDLRAGEHRWRKRLMTLEADLEVKAAAIDGRLVELSDISGLLVPPQPPRSGLNLTKRSQALQMHRRGTTAPEIADALGLPQNEVELLVKIQRIALASLKTARHVASASVVRADKDC